MRITKLEARLLAKGMGALADEEHDIPQIKAMLALRYKLLAFSYDKRAGEWSPNTEDMSVEEMLKRIYKRHRKTFLKHLEFSTHGYMLTEEEKEEALELQKR